jgi:hypothetical protein
MILLFGEKATKSKSSGRSSNIKNHPVENSGILANRGKSTFSLLDANEYDIYMFSQQASIDYSLYSEDPTSGDIAFLSDYSTALAMFSDGGDCASFTTASFGGDCGCSCGGFASVC